MTRLQNAEPYNRQNTLNNKKHTIKYNNHLFINLHGSNSTVQHPVFVIVTVSQSVYCTSSVVGQVWEEEEEVEGQRTAHCWKGRPALGEHLPRIHCFSRHAGQPCWKMSQGCFPISPPTPAPGALCKWNGRYGQGPLV